jgi:prepilin-type N-terminal cleavage/methylation domain-containing protein
MKTNYKNLNAPEGNLHLIPCPYLPALPLRQAAGPWQGEGCPEGGLSFFPGRKFRGRTAGFTLIEVLIGIGISAILILGLTRLFSATLNSYSLQEQLTEMNQNAKFAMKEISDVLMQAGADCQLVNGDTLDKDTFFLVASTPPCTSFTIRVNPRGGFYTVTNAFKKTVAKCSVQVDNSYAFRYADKLGKIPESNSSPSRSVVIYSLDGIDSAHNKICITGANDSFYVGDGLYSFCSQSYYLKGANLCLNSDTNVMAENIDSLKITFMDSAGTSTTIWSKIMSAKLVVEATTSVPDNRYVNPPWNDHRRRLNLTYQFRLKNKV